MQPRTVQTIFASVPSDVRRWPEFAAWVENLKQGVHDHVRAIHFSMQAGDSDVHAAYELAQGIEQPVDVFDVETKTSINKEANVTSKAKAALMARVRQHAEDAPPAEPAAPAPTSVTVESDDAEGIKVFRQWLVTNAAKLTVKTDEVDDVTTFFLFNKNGEYLGYYSYEAGGAYGLQPRDHSELETLIEPHAEADLEPVDVQRLTDYIDSYYPA